jgi:hypothetical protein
LKEVCPKLVKQISIDYDDVYIGCVPKATQLVPGPEAKPQAATSDNANIVTRNLEPFDETVSKLVPRGGLRLKYKWRIVIVKTRAKKLNVSPLTKERSKILSAT